MSQTCTATATNSAGSKATSVTITVGSSGGGGTIACNFAGPTHVIPVTWGVTPQSFTSQNGGFGPTDALVLKFTTPANGGTLLKRGSLSASEYLDPINPRYGTLSTTACDYAGTTAVPLAGGGPPPTQIFCLSSQTACSTSVSFGFTFNPLKTGNALLQPNTTYYLNIGNQSGSCYGAGSCNMIFNWTWPSS